ncbi:MAG: hypothetical protein Alis3KO_34780 [Aliiglaciecola sp.]|uniref:ATP-grasp domain-containing protein n=1 Tax=Aliiglaciecola sp. M165 TaxID=2593649 RepID=UPI00117D8E08|nr:hypothetical protein [Aliiglaciecola sp. M165]TRY34000.1 hypothetical protein FM019_01720 [Aliiglaciecola sp. M165]
MRKLAILSTDDLEEFFVYDHLFYPFLVKNNWECTEVSWRDDSVNWNEFDVVVIRSTWDYQEDPEKFIACLESIENSSAVLENSLQTVQWNISKDYLKALQSQGIEIVPTLWFSESNFAGLLAAFEDFDCSEIVIKPLVSANADHTYRLRKSDVVEQKDALQSVFATRPHMVQPFIQNIVNEGEYSLFYFNGQFSHCILKVPKNNDFRVQEEHGGQLRSVQADQAILEASEKVIRAIPEMPLYVRVDFVKHNNAFLLMEVELIEPSLYFNMDNDSPRRFAQAFLDKHGEG